MLLSAFFDDSGTHASSPVVTLGGLLGTADQWEAFQAAWIALLKSPIPGKPPLKEFHLSHCRAARGEFRDYSLVERDYLTKLFRKIILDLGLVTIAAAVDNVAWTELIVGEIKSELGSPEEYCFVKCVDTVVNTIRSRKPGREVVIVFDQGTRKRLEGWAQFYLSQKERYPEIIDFGFGKVSDTIALQGADMMALETNQFGREWIKDRDNPVSNPHFADFRSRDLSTGLIVDRGQIKKLIAVVQARARTHKSSSMS